jgi:hypothetical protein
MKICTKCWATFNTDMAFHFGCPENGGYTGPLEDLPDEEDLIDIESRMDELRVELGYTEESVAYLTKRIERLRRLSTVSIVLSKAEPPFVRYWTFLCTGLRLYLTSYKYVRDRNVSAARALPPTVIEEYDPDIPGGSKKGGVLYLTLDTVTIPSEIAESAKKQLTSLMEVIKDLPDSVLLPTFDELKDFGG